MTHHFHYNSAASIPLFIKQDDAATTTPTGIQLFTGYLSGVDGVRTVFSTEHYFDAATVHVERNGLVQKQGEDYTAIINQDGKGTAVEFAVAPIITHEPDTIFIKYKILGNKI